MDDMKQRPPLREPLPRHGALALLWAAGLATLLLPSGCSLVTMGGRMLLGDTKAKSQFKKVTLVDLAKSKAKVLVLCSGTDFIRSSYPSVEYDILDSVTRMIKTQGVVVVSPNAVASWLDDHGGRIGDLNPIAEKFKADYIIHIQLDKFSCTEPNSPNLLRGLSEGNVLAYKVQGEKGEKSVLEIMNSEFTSSYPLNNPVSIDTRSAKNFQQDYIERVSLQLAQLFYDHPVREEMQ